METQERKINATPKISINKFGEFMTATPSRRHKILFDQKYPNNFVVTRYNDAEKSIINYLYDNKNDITILDKAIKELERKPISSDWDILTKRLNYEAIDAFYDIADKIDNSKYLVKKSSKSKSASIMIEDVEISIRPEILIFLNKDDKKYVGSMKLYLSKTYPLSKDGGEYIASLMMEYMKLNEIDFVVKNKMCSVIDIFNKNIIVAPTSYKQRMLNIRAACQDISAIWNRL